MATAVLPVRTRRNERARRVSIAQHCFAAGLLIFTAMNHLDGGHFAVLPILELAAGVTLIGAVLYQRFRKSHPRVGWVDFAASAMLFVEAIAKLQERHHTSFYILSFFPPVLLLFVGLYDERIREGMRMEANDEGFLLQTRLFWWKRVPWAGLTTYAITPTRIALFRQDGRVKEIKTKDLINRDEAVAWAEEQFVARGLTKR